MALGAVGLLTLSVGSTVEGLTRGAGYDVLDHWISLLAIGPRAALGTALLAVPGVLLVLCSIGVRMLAGEAPGGGLAAGSVALLGLSMIGASVFPVDPVATYPMGPPVEPSLPSSLPSSMGTMSPDGRLHSLFGATALICFVLVPLTGARASQCDARLRRLGPRCALVAGAATVVGVALVAATGGQRWDAAYAGGLQRIALYACTFWLGAAAVRALASARSVMRQSR